MSFLFCLKTNASAVENASSWNQGSLWNHANLTRKGNYAPCAEDLVLRVHMAFLKVPIYAPVFLRNTLLALTHWKHILVPFCSYQYMSLCVFEGHIYYILLSGDKNMCPAWNLLLSQLCLFEDRTNKCPSCPCMRLLVISIYMYVPLFDWQRHVLSFYHLEQKLLPYST